MAQIILNIPDNQLSRVVTGICTFYGYSATLMDGTVNPETANAFAKRMLIEQTEKWVATIEGAAANKTAYNTALSQITIT